MIEIDEIREPHKTNYTPIIILGIVALLLVVVGFISYKDWVDSQADKKVTQSNNELEELKKQVQALANAQNQPATPDPKLARISSELAAMQDKLNSNTDKLDSNTMMMDKVLKQTDPPGSSSTKEQDDLGVSLFGPVPNLDPGGPANSQFAAGGTIRDELSNSMRDAVLAPPGGMSPAAKQELLQMEAQIRNTPSIGSVVAYDKDWNVVTINAGARNNLKRGTRYMVKRGANLLGKIEIDKVSENQSVAFFVNSEQLAESGVLPQAGDQIVAVQPF